jgi:hypothetical protein
MRRFAVVMALVGLWQSGTPVRAARAVRTGSNIQTIYLVHTSHWDYGFTDPPQNLPALLRDHVNDAVAKCQADPRNRYTIEHTWALEDYLSAASPSEIDALLAQMRAGHIAVGAGYTGPHSGPMSAEELNRWIYRNKTLRDRYQISSRAAHCDDNPGYAWAMADALSGSGVDRLVVGQNNVFGGTVPLPLNETLFRWLGAGGGQVLTWVSRGGYLEGAEHWHIDTNVARFFFSGDHPEWATMTDLQIMEQGINEQLAQFDAAGYPYDSVLVLEAFDKMNYDPSGQLLAKIDAWNQTHTTPQIKLATADEFFDHMEATYGTNAFPAHSGNWSFRWEETKISGQTSQSRFRELRDTIPAAEALASAALRFGVPYPSATFDAAWRDLMRFDDHGAGAGGTQPLEMTYDEMNQTNLYWTQTSLARRDEVRASLASSAAALASQIATTPGANPEIVVFNPLSSERTELASATVSSGGQPFALRDVATGAAVAYETRPDGSIRFVAEHVPPLGYRRYRVLLGVTDPSSPSATVVGGTIQNAYYRVTVNLSTGAITSIVDKTNGNRQLVNTSSAFAFDRTARASNTTVFFGGAPTPLVSGAPTLSAAIGPVSGALTLDFPAPGAGGNASPLAQVEIRLYANLKRIDIVDTNDRSRLAYEVPTDAVSQHFYMPLPFALPVGSLQTIVDANASAPLRPPTATYLAGPSEVATNNVHFPSRGITLRDAATSYEVQVVSPQVFVYYVGADTATDYDPAEATLIAEVMSKQDRTQTDDPGYPDLPFVIEPLENDPSQGYQVFTSQFSITSGAARSASAEGAWGASVCAPMPTAVVAGGRQGPLTDAARSFYSVDAPNVEIVAVKRPDFGDPADTILRVRERDGIVTNTFVRTAFPVLAAAECTLLEEPTSALATAPVPLALGPNQTKTLRLRLASLVATERDTAGVYVPATGAWFVRNHNSSGPADATVTYGPPNLAPLAGDWNADGADGLGVYDAGASVFFLKNAVSGGPADAVFGFGPPGAGWVPLSGDWNGDGRETVGLYDPATGAFFLRNANSPGAADLVFTFGPPGATPLVGDWNGDGVDTVGIYVAATGAFFLKNANSSGAADVVFTFGAGGAGLTPLADDWNGDGIDSVGLYQPATGAFFLRNANSSGPADLTFTYGPPGVVPVTGNWDGL